jgi:hypothetical protein
MKFKQIIFSGHALKRMFERSLSEKDIIDVIRDGEVITQYSFDKPYPSCIILGFVRDVPLHVVIGIDSENQAAVVITAYIPDLETWTVDFRTRRNT